MYVGEAELLAPFRISEGLIMKRSLATSCLAVIVTLAACGWAQGEVVVVAYYRLGEADPGAMADSPVGTLTMDSGMFGLNMNLVGNLSYSADVAPSAATATGSTLSISDPTAAGYAYIVPQLTTATDNFGIEGWFKLTDPTMVNVLAWNGNLGNPQSGWGLITYQGTLQGYYPQIALLDTGFTPTANEWFYVALVRDNGVAKIYINGTTPLTPTSADATPVEPAVLSALTTGGSADGMKGLLDEVRIFTFSPGAFDASKDLLIVPPREPVDLAIFQACSTGPMVTGRPEGCTEKQFKACDSDSDGDVDQVDFGAFQLRYPNT
jgi:hypothetical protein